MSAPLRKSINVHTNPIAFQSIYREIEMRSTILNRTVLPAKLKAFNYARPIKSSKRLYTVYSEIGGIEFFLNIFNYSNATDDFADAIQCLG